MIRFPRAGAALAAALLVAFSAAGSAPAAAASAAPPSWPQAKSDLKPDPQIVFGVLPNGMRYAIRRQTIPAGQAALRLWIGAGSLNESDAQRGLAHFLEHMAFNGSKAVKEGEMIKILERLGLAFGPDTNASTSFEETVYKLDLPRTDDETVDTSLMLLRETAGELTIAPDAVDRERGVVLSEERARDTPGYRNTEARLGFFFAGQRLPERLPIGKVEVLKTAPADRIVDFYRRNYRPEHAVLVAAGDFDPAVMEARIRARFGDWRAAAPPLPDPSPGPVRPRGVEARLVVEPGAPLGLQLAWIRPPDRSADTIGKQRRQLVDQLGLAVLNRRFSALARGAQPPFLGASAGRYDQNQAADVTLVNTVSETSRWREALAAIEQEQRRAAQFGVRQDELDREIVETRANLRAAAEGGATRRPAELADEIIGSLSEHDVVTSPQQDLALFERLVKGIKAPEVSAALQRSFKGAGPLIFVSTPKPIEGGEATVLSAYRAAHAEPVRPPAASARIAWPYADFGPAGQVAEQHEVADLGVSFVRFANGVRLTVKPTAFRDDEVLVRVNIGRGLLDLPRDVQAATWAGGALVEGGLGKITNEDMERVLADKVYGVRFGATDDAFVLSGGTRTEDLPTELQVLAGYASDPGWRPEAFDRLKASGATIHDQYEATDSGVLSRDLGGLLHAGDRRWTFPGREAIAAATLADLRGQVGPRLAEGPIEVVVVGDVKTASVIEAVGRTFGALPPRPEPAPLSAEQRRTGFPAPNRAPLTLTHKGRADQSIAYIAWPTEDIWADRRRVWATSVLGEVLRTRLTEQIREAEGSTYSPSVNYAHSRVWTGWGYLAASVEVPPDHLQGFFDEVGKITADLRAKPVSEDELARARQPRVQGLQRARVTNQYWLAELSGAQADPRELDLIREVVPGATEVTAADVQAAAQAFLREDAAFRLIVRPAKP
jgi:zinc protease